MLSAFKSFSYCLMHLAVAMAVAFALTGSWAIALGIGLIEPMVQTVFYALHERVWDRLLARRRGRPTRLARARA